MVTKQLSSPRLSREKKNLFGVGRWPNNLHDLLWSSQDYYNINKTASKLVIRVGLKEGGRGTHSNRDKCAIIKHSEILLFASLWHSIRWESEQFSSRRFRYRLNAQANLRAARRMEKNRITPLSAIKFLPIYHRIPSVNIISISCNLIVWQILLSTGSFSLLCRCHGQTIGNRKKIDARTIENLCLSRAPIKTECLASQGCF